FGLSVNRGLGAGARRVALHRLAPARIEPAGNRRRADAAPLELFGNLGVKHGQHPVVALVVGEGNMAIGFEFEALTLGIVVNGIGYVMVSAHSRCNTLAPAANIARCLMPDLTLYHASPS